MIHERLATNHSRTFGHQTGGNSDGWHCQDCDWTSAWALDNIRAGR